MVASSRFQPYCRNDWCIFTIHVVSNDCYDSVLLFDNESYSF